MPILAASTNVTGSAAAGGNWQLEAATGPVDAQVAVSRSAQTAWVGVLQAATGTAVLSNASTTPQASAWNGSSFGATSGTAALPDRYRIMQGADAPTRNEKIVVGIDASGNVTGVMWNGTSWSALPINNLGTVSETYWWGADVAYEQVSGDALVVWNDNSQAAGLKLRYAVWNGSSWSTPQSIAAYTGTEPQNVTLAVGPSSDVMVLYATTSPPTTMRSSGTVRAGAMPPPWTPREPPRTTRTRWASPSRRRPAAPWWPTTRIRPQGLLQHLERHELDRRGQRRRARRR